MLSDFFFGGGVEVKEADPVLVVRAGHAPFDPCRDLHCDPAAFPPSGPPQSKIAASASSMSSTSTSGSEAETARSRDFPAAAAESILSWASAAERLSVGGAMRGSTVGAVDEEEELDVRDEISPAEAVD